MHNCLTPDIRVPPVASSNASKVSDMLESETRKMEEKLALVKKMMEMEREKRSLVNNSN